jgi:hypothetical protein
MTCAADAGGQWGSGLIAVVIYSSALANDRDRNVA